MTIKTKYICRLHNQPPEDVAFQDCQFDKGLRRARHPEGTNHIRNQASTTLTGDDAYNEAYRKSDD